MASVTPSGALHLVGIGSTVLPHMTVPTHCMGSVIPQTSKATLQTPQSGYPLLRAWGGETAPAPQVWAGDKKKALE